VTKLLAHLSAHFNTYDDQHGAVTILIQRLKIKDESVVQYRLWYNKTKKGIGIFFLVECIVTGFVYLDMLEQFIMPTLEERVPMTCYSSRPL